MKIKKKTKSFDFFNDVQTREPKGEIPYLKNKKGKNTQKPQIKLLKWTANIQISILCYRWLLGKMNLYGINKLKLLTVSRLRKPKNSRKYFIGIDVKLTS